MTELHFAAFGAGIESHGPLIHLAAEHGMIPIGS